MNNEPVAWMMVNRENTSAYLTFEKPTRDMKISHELTPLYTHPVKELTDEEIDNISDEIPHYIDTYMGRRMFARAILIKAQEK
jgi:hypothetical protein